MPWVKGQSGNPEGRRSEYSEIKALARKHGPAAVNKLAELMAGDDPRVAAAAATALLDRGYGKPAQTQILTGDEDGGPVKVEKIQRDIVRANTPNPNG